MSVGFLKVPRVFFDSAIAGAVGTNQWLVYLAMRRFERTDGSWSPRVAKLIEDGHLVAYVNQTKLALLLGLSRSTITRAVKWLVLVQWIQEVRLKDNGRAYKLGFVTDPDKAGHVQTVYFAEAWLTRSLAAMPSGLNGWKHADIQRRRDALVLRLQRVIDGEDDVFGCLPKMQRPPRKAARKRNPTASFSRNRAAPRG